MIKRVPLDRLREVSRQRAFGRRVTAADAVEQAEQGEERVEWPISR